MSTGWNYRVIAITRNAIINLLGNEYWLELGLIIVDEAHNYKPTGK